MWLETGVAAWRVTRFWIEDELAQGAREWVSRWLLDVDEVHMARGRVEVGSRSWVVREKVDYLLGCPFCLSVWVGAGLTLVRRWPAGRWLVSWLAAAGVAALAAERSPMTDDR